MTGLDRLFVTISSRQYHLLLLLDSTAFYRACSSTLSWGPAKFTFTCLFIYVRVSLRVTLHIILHANMRQLYFSMYHLSRHSPDIHIVIITAVINGQSLLPLLSSNLYLQNGLTPHSHFCPDEYTGTTQDSQCFTIVSAPWWFWLAGSVGRIWMKTAAVMQPMQVLGETNYICHSPESPLQDHLCPSILLIFAKWHSYFTLNFLSGQRYLFANWIISYFPTLFNQLFSIFLC